MKDFTSLRASSRCGSENGVRGSSRSMTIASAPEAKPSWMSFSSLPAQNSSVLIGRASCFAMCLPLFELSLKTPSPVRRERVVFLFPQHRRCLLLHNRALEELRIHAAVQRHRIGEGEVAEIVLGDAAML